MIGAMYDSGYGFKAMVDWRTRNRPGVATAVSSHEAMCNVCWQILVHLGGVANSQMLYLNASGYRQSLSFRGGIYVVTG